MYIYVKKISKYLTSRYVCNIIFASMYKDDDVYLDFTGVYYISREFAEAYKYMKSLSKKNIIEINLPYYYRSLF
ncbi:hypothetical protein [Picrophilus oshimae]|uniref:DUF4325 domain-containing protein n=1 Tax=Picrophilus torridus (strain ATCC 700027 / DSM 9790 / JCM 10055 / NBRC 100828 / KAW 2/3) TaxID=1122961 RepID=A0A8G2FVB0_PICTO|nr:hypothetical protein [Picrophilus oshimae]SMD30143.1 hypothetical protein SAMN02745355_0004 [Picrophilus oshimae DSM 9789]